MAVPRFPWQRLSPRQRQVLGAVVLVAGVVVVGRQLHGSTPRDVEVHVPLGAILRAGFAPREVEVTFARGTAVLRTLDRRYGTDIPSELVQTLQLPEGAVHTHVSITLDDRVIDRDETLVIRAGETLEVSPPSLPLQPGMDVMPMPMAPPARVIERTAPPR